ncbi:hypothetical protein Leryth_010262 [Lithospermum erythrorhizon]|uniref:DNA-binding transcription factor n=1 Tax=Lithospermum erythrorhizon TaxID=34254 RepID=A0AAV3PD02_LITER|nr:hypothetical protein Leryth_010262 [Lithospermum erythrorhizon]
MVKPGSPLKEKHENETNSSSCKFRGVRKRKWGKYVSEIRLPNSRKRIWLGSYDTAEKAARAFDAALFCLRGNSAKFNFPDNPPEIVNGRSLTSPEIQVEAARFANSYSGSSPGRVENLEQEHSSSLSSSEIHVDSPSLSVSDGNINHFEGEIPEIPLDMDFLNSFSNMSSTSNFNNNLADYEIFPGYDDLYIPQMPPSDDYGNENFDFFPQEGSSFLWNF